MHAESLPQLLTRISVFPSPGEHRPLAMEVAEKPCTRVHMESNATAASFRCGMHGVAMVARSSSGTVDSELRQRWSARLRHVHLKES